ncbi:phosphotyrosine interaction domain (PTB/PID) domain-containing protein [Phthorimaea operculella]|nr:phosphotyrosine interaction domain (PTB/PID) domain-containing protein [Phthorimaea operculella]
MNLSSFTELNEEWILAECEGEGWWRESKEPINQIDVRYAGVAPVERAASAPATALAVRSALHTAKTSHKKQQRVNLDISSKGIVVTDADSQQNVISVSIYRISYCSADAANARVFAVVEAHAFTDAYQEWQANQGSSLQTTITHTNPWVEFATDSDEEIDEDQWHSPAPLVTF